MQAVQSRRRKMPRPSALAVYSGVQVLDEAATLSCDSLRISAWSFGILSGDAATSTDDIGTKIVSVIRRGRNDRARPVRRFSTRYTSYLSQH